MAKAAHLSGKAINITKTTAPHALSYYLTSHFGIPHGHAVALFLGPFIEFNYRVSLNDCNDTRGHLYVKSKIEELNDLLKTSSAKESRMKVEELMTRIGLQKNLRGLSLQHEIIPIITNVDEERLKNNPRKINKNELISILTEN